MCRCHCRSFKPRALEKKKEKYFKNIVYIGEVARLPSVFLPSKPIPVSKEAPGRIPPKKKKTQAEFATHKCVLRILFRRHALRFTRNAYKERPTATAVDNIIPRTWQGTQRTQSRVSEVKKATPRKRKQETPPRKRCLAVQHHAPQCIFLYAERSRKRFPSGVYLGALDLDRQ